MNRDEIMAPLYPRRKIHAILDDIPVPSLNGAASAQTLCDYIGHCAHSDLRMQAWQVRAVSCDPFKIEGWISNPFSLRVLEKAVAHLGGTCDSSAVIPLPAAALGDNSYAIVTEECPIYANTDQTERMDTALPGDALVLLRYECGAFLLHSANGYIGWAQAAHLQPVGSTAWVAAINQQAPDHDERIKTMQKTANGLLGTKYVWGGMSKQGIDCSGFTNTVYRSIGVHLPRDADQQYLTGRICATPQTKDALRWGDLLFFSGPAGRISHVAVAIDPGAFAHAEDENQVCIRTWEEKPNLVERFVCGKRLLA
ncbi:MAG: C40 family peptidase [Candidatus Hinthialibacter antarcticus]|nr:C40 family peptidase [Candidatus Hinthialibacter antarcticus]